MQVRILIAEDDHNMRDFLVQALTEEGYFTLSVGNGLEAIELLENESFDIILTDLKMPRATGMDVLTSVRSRSLPYPVIFMTAFGTIESAVEAMKLGAYSYITKPFDLDDLLTLLQEVSEQVRPRIEIESGTMRSGDRNSFPIVYRSQLFQSVVSKIQSVADSPASVLITGETGTGKELIAKELHRCSSRNSKPLVVVNVNTIPENLLESELFGYRKGAFTGADRDHAGLVEQADGGTLFLDEIGDLSLQVQVKLLRFLQDRTFRRVGDTQQRHVDVRLVAATNRNLGEELEKGNLREDLYYRLAVITINAPPLRERRADIPVLAYHFLRKYDSNNRITGFRPEILDLLTDYDWPGNVRQLEGAVEHAVILRKSGIIQKRDFPEWFAKPEKAPDENPRSLEAVEREHILDLLRKCGGNRSRTARILGIDRRTLGRKLSSYGILDDDKEDESVPG
jgi:two-component system response regulator HydG